MSSKEELLRMYSSSSQRSRVGNARGSNMPLIILSVIVAAALVWATSGSGTGGVAVTAFLMMMLPFGIGGYYVGRRTGNGLEGFWFSCLLGPIGLVIAFVLDDKTREPCSVCAESIKLDAKSCPHCGAER